MTILLTRMVVWHALAQTASIAISKLYVTWSRESLVKEATLDYFDESGFTDEQSHKEIKCDPLRALERRYLKRCNSQHQQACDFW